MVTNWGITADLLKERFFIQRHLDRWRNEPTGNHIKLTRHDAKFGTGKARDLAMVQGEN